VLSAVKWIEVERRDIYIGVQCRAVRCPSDIVECINAVQCSGVI